MKLSIVSLLSQLKIHLLIVTICSITILLFNTSQIQTSSILKSLYSHQELVKKLSNLDKNEPDLTLIKLEELHNMLQFNSDNLNTKLSLDFIGNYFQDAAYHKEQINLLHDHTMKYHGAMHTYVTSKSIYTNNQNILDAEHSSIDASLSTLIELNNNILFQKEAINSYFIYFTVFYIILIAIIYYSKINVSVRDLNAINVRKPDYVYEVKELDYLSKALTKVDESRRGEAFIDPLSRLNNLRGLLNKYSKQTIASNYTYYIYVFSIDNYKAIRSHISEENSQAVLKKIAFIVSLYEKANDYTARVGYDEFVLILPSDNKDAAQQECEQLRKTIEETVFNFIGIDLKHLTASGVFVPKPKDKTIEATIDYGINFLKSSKKREVNKNVTVLGF